MLFLTASSIGIAAGLTRSAFSIAMAAFLIVATFALASILGSGAPHYLKLLIAIVGYNAGLIVLLGAAVILRRPRSA